MLDIGDGRRHHLLIRVKDTDNNQTTLSFDVQYAPPPDSAVPPAGEAPSPPPAASGKKFYPGMLDGIELPDCAFYLNEHSLYDSVVIDAMRSGYPGSGNSLPGGVSAAYAIGAPWIPLNAPLLVRLRPLPDGADSTHREHLPTVTDLTPREQPTDHIVMVRWNGKDRDVQQPEWKDGWASARFAGFGHFQLVRDTTPPTIGFRGIKDNSDLGKASRIGVDVHDNLGATRHFRAELDGAWLCFSNDKNLAWIYTFDEHCPPGRHTLRVSVEDMAGNKTVKEINFTR